MAPTSFRRPACRRGVSLVEVLAALALIAAVAPALNRSWVLTMTATSRSADEITAATLAENKLAEIVAAGAEPTGEDSGQFEAPHEGYRWAYERGAWVGDGRMTRIDVTVTWTRRGADFETTVSTLTSGGER